MSRPVQSFSSKPRPPSAADRLDSWKEIAAYLKRSVRTVRRWESEQDLPVHRHVHQSLGTVYAFKSELDIWWASRAAELESTTEQEPSELVEATPRRGRLRTTWLIGIALVAIVVLSIYFGVGRFGGTSASTPARVMLAVLPLDNLSPDPEQDYFSDGLTEEIILDLGRLNPERLGVIARTSVMRYKKTRQGIDQIGRELHVDYVLEGSVRRQADQVRVAVQLIRVNDQTHVWATSYDKNARDVLGLQAEVAQALSRAIEIKLTPESKRRLARIAAVNHEAHDAYLMGRYFWNKRTPETLTKAIAYFEQALRADPNYALAYAGLADCYAVLPNYSNVSDREASVKTEIAATRALKMDPNLGEVYATLASISQDHWDWAEAERRFKQAIQLSPNYATAHQWYAGYLQQVGRLDEAATELKKAQELDPLSVIINAVMANQLYFERRYDEAIVQSRKVLEMEPGLTDFRSHLGLIFMAKGMLNEAIIEFRKTRELAPNDPKPIGLLGTVYAISGKPAEARDALRELDALVRRGQPRAAFYSAFVHIALGEKDLGFDLLDRAVEEHIGVMAWLKVSPAFDLLRGDPRYRLLLKRMNLPTDL
jgi:TolB-like protein/Flp pilus assembly protein TadD